jgi:hypothetical protein
MDEDRVIDEIMNLDKMEKPLYLQMAGIDIERSER